jgi:hypothetical protein
MTEEPNRVRNIYEDEQDKIEDRFHEKLELSLKIMELLDQYDYDLDARLVEGMPEIKLIKRI